MVFATAYPRIHTLQGSTFEVAGYSAVTPTEQLIFVSLKLKKKREKKKREKKKEKKKKRKKKRKKREITKNSLHPESIAVHLNGRGAQYH